MLLMLLYLATESQCCGQNFECQFFLEEVAEFAEEGAIYRTSQPSFASPTDRGVGNMDGESELVPLARTGCGLFTSHSALPLEYSFQLQPEISGSWKAATL